MNTQISTTRRILNLACTIYTAITLALIVVSILFADLWSGATVNALRFLLIFPFSFCTAALWVMLSSDKIGGVVKFFVHYIGSALSFYLCLLLPITGNKNPSSTLVLMFFLSLVYIAVYIPVYLAKRKRKVTDEDYKSSFSQE